MLNAIVWQDRDRNRSLGRARSADEALARRMPLGALHGATVAPIGRTAAGLPVGMQIVAPMWEDATSIEFAALLSDLAGGFAPPPTFVD